MRAGGSARGKEGGIGRETIYRESWRVRGREVER